MAPWVPRLRLWFDRLRSRLRSLLFSPPCALCGQPARCHGLCHPCRDRVLGCQLPDRLQRQQCGNVDVWIWGEYRRPLRDAIIAWKYRDHQSLSALFGDAMADGWLARPAPVPVTGRPLLIPIPIHRHRRQQRGFNQAELLAQRLGDRLGFAVVPDGLVRIRETQAQFRLSKVERRRNLAGAFQLGKSLHDRQPKRPIILVDDIYTSGTTVAEAVSVLHRHRWTVIAIAVLARPLGNTSARTAGRPARPGSVPRRPKPKRLR